MRLNGILRSWNEGRGFGFIAPTHGGAELFVHISAFPRDGSRPVEGESLSYELGRGTNGKPQAVRVIRQAIGSRAPKTQMPKRRARSASPLRGIAMVGLVVTVLAFGYNQFAKSPGRSAAALSAPVNLQASPPSAYRCDGRTYCSQMTSCAEATYFLKNCPGVKMDGNNDGVPCEQQWCR
ncbi:MAG: cold shock domain-containing protein [Caldimonas sp.]